MCSYWPDPAAFLQQGDSKDLSMVIFKKLTYRLVAASDLNI